MNFHNPILLLLVSACTGVYSDPALATAPAGPTDPTDTVDPPQIVSGNKRAFVTSTTYQGGVIGGLAGADAKCAAHASAGGLAGSYKAWLSDSHKSAASRLTHSTGTYSLIDGTLVAASWDDLVATRLQHAIDHDELGRAIPGSLDCYGSDITAAWTQTTIKGDIFRQVTFGCTDWTEISNDRGSLGANVGLVMASDSFWTEGVCGITCTERAALYCLEQ